mmetsp:Transcript_117185/g.332061  ORF Transcript_117185/g.332061 Transcript_117185/m.332061 type:complete len:361 (-) Transcript_117185:151-1233(-)
MCIWYRHGRDDQRHLRNDEGGGSLCHHRLLLRRHEPVVPGVLHAAGHGVHVRRHARQRERAQGDEAEHEAHLHGEPRESSAGAGRPRGDLEDREGARRHARLRRDLRDARHVQAHRPRRRHGDPEPDEVLRGAQHDDRRRRHLRHEGARGEGQVGPERAREHHEPLRGVHHTADDQDHGPPGEAAVQERHGHRAVPREAPQGHQGRLPGPGLLPPEGARGQAAPGQPARRHALVRHRRGFRGRHAPDELVPEALEPLREPGRDGEHHHGLRGHDAREHAEGGPAQGRDHRRLHPGVVRHRGFGGPHQGPGCSPGALLRRRVRARRRRGRSPPAAIHDVGSSDRRFEQRGSSVILMVAARF